MAALSFCYAPPLSGQYDQYVKQDEALIISDLQDKCQKIMTARGCQISVMTTKSTKQLGSSTNCPTEFNISMTGSPQALMEARGDLLSHCPLEVSKFDLKREMTQHVSFRKNFYYCFFTYPFCNMSTTYTCISFLYTHMLYLFRSNSSSEFHLIPICHY